MKDFNEEQLERARPDRDLADCADHCLRALYADRSKSVSDHVVEGLTFEELIGTLLLARDLSAPMMSSDELDQVFGPE